MFKQPRKLSRALAFPLQNNEAIKRVTFSEAPKHNKLTSPDIQKDITQASAKEITNERFKLMRENDWEFLVEEMSSFCIKHDIDILNMDDEYKLLGLMVLGDQLDTYIIDLYGDDEFSGIEGIASLVEKMVKTKKNLIFPLVYMLIKLSLYFYQLQLLQWREFFLLCILSRVDCGT
ncbi:hypothetical protein NC652_010903 [Populus alba x Populus x berolinensis]|nr:hypothetical protein NC652_010903 [Populus alba x Populus x berolinensis]